MSEMTIEKIKVYQKALEEAVLALVDSFENQTGMNVQHIDFNEASFLGSSKKTTKVGAVITATLGE